MIDNADAVTIIAALQERKFETRFIGGCVRDALLQRPLSDIDLATTATPQDVIAILRGKNIQVVETGIEHGTVTAVLDKKPFEITTLRSDVETDGRHALVKFSLDWQTDARRRDFTINAISLDAAGKVFDYCDGIDDLRHQRLRFIGDAEQRISEDYLRILRFFRFASVLDWQIDDAEVLHVCARLAPQLRRLSRERIQNELYKLLSGPGCLRISELMERHRIWEALLSRPIEQTRLQKLLALENRDGENDAFRRLLALAGWQSDTELEKIVILTRALKKRLEDLRAVQEKQQWPLAKKLYFFGPLAVRDFHYLHDLELDDHAVTLWKKPEFPLKAEDIMHLTHGPGPAVGEMLKRAEAYWSDRDFAPTAPELLTYIAMPSIGE